MDVSNLQTVVDLPAAAALLGIGRTKADELVRDGAWPMPVIRLGELIKVPTRPLLDLLEGRVGPRGLSCSNAAGAATSSGPAAPVACRSGVRQGAGIGRGSSREPQRRTLRR